MKIGIIGLGYVGLPLAVAFAEAGHEVVGLDTDPRKIEALDRRQQLHRGHPRRGAGAAQRQARATGDYAELETCDAVIVCVPTPLTSSREPDLTYLIDASNALAKVLRSGQLVVLESTTYPGTTRERLLPILEESGMSAGDEFHLAFSPERIDPGRTDHTIRTTPKLVGGVTEACAERARELYSRDLRRGRRPLDPGGRRAREAAREHLPLGQHRPRQRALPALRPARHRRLGGDRRRGDQAVRVHALRPRARDGRPLPAGRPLLPRLQGPRTRLLPRVHRARRKGQPRPARLLRRPRSPAP